MSPIGNTDIVVETERLPVRIWKDEDIPVLHSIMSDVEVMRYVWDYKPATFEQVRDFVNKCIQESGE